MCGCIVALAAMLSPPLALFLIWLFGDRMDVATRPLLAKL